MREPNRLVSDCCLQIGQIAMAIDSSHHVAITKPTEKCSEHSAADWDIATNPAEHEPQHALNPVRYQSVLRVRVP
jgi:hypothetical protein